MDRRNENNNSLEQEQKKQTGKDIEPERDPVKPQEETKKDN
ncbi:hypothetical protein [Bacillus sp. FJAT-27245]|nr:hypothetical protein [Bacillus sp. FJAT-27245]